MDMRATRTKRKPKAEMNVVPYIDVMLVLLVIFMVTAPMMTQGVQIELPKVAAEALEPDNPASIVTVSVEASGGYHWNLGESVETDSYEHTTATLDDLTRELSAVTSTQPDTQVFIRADAAAGYGVVVAAMAALQQAGITQLGLITEAP